MLHHINFITFILIFLLSACDSSSQKLTSDLQYMSGEHKVLGDRAFGTACRNFPQDYCQYMVAREDQKEFFSYGDLVALGGDYYEDPDSFFYEKTKPFYQYPNNLNATRRKFAEEIRIINKYMHGNNIEDYPHFEFNYAFYYLDFLPIILHNNEHLGFYNMIAYVRFHLRALQIAAIAGKLKDSDPQAATFGLNKAIFYNGFGDHFLTDGFAAGHIRNPRLQIHEWASRHEMNFLKAAVLSGVIHDNDGSLSLTSGKGLLVKNSLGESWFTRSDAELFRLNSLDDLSIRQPEAAVIASLQELFETYDSGVVPLGTFKAIWKVPFIHPDESSLTEVFPAHASKKLLDAIIHRVPWFMKLKPLTGFDGITLLQFFAALPEIVARFKLDAAGIIASDPQLKERLPPLYIDGYLDLH